ncbi:hypothetical protein E2320_009690, partial [Naja naja]
MEYENLNLEHLRIVGYLDGQSHQGRTHFHLGHFNVFLKDVVFPQEIHFHALYLELIVAGVIMTALKPYVAAISDVAAVVESHQCFLGVAQEIHLNALSKEYIAVVMIMIVQEDKGVATIIALGSVNK